MEKNRRLIFFGNSSFSLPVLTTLISSGLTPDLIVTSPDKPAGRHLVPAPNPVKSFSQGQHIPVVESIQELLNELSKTTDNRIPIGLVAAFGRILKPPVLEKFSGRLYNLHPSLLPLYRGPSPLQSQILDRTTNTGVTLIRMDEQVDHGPIIATSTDTITPNDTAESLGQRLFSKGAKLFAEFLAHPDKFSPQNQDDSLATFTHLLTRQDGFIPYAQFISQIKTADPEILIKFRALSPWPGIWTNTPENKRLKLTAVTPDILVQLEGRSPMPLPQLHL